MAYQTQTFTDNETVLTAAMMDHIEAGIVANETSIEDVSTDLASYYVQKNAIATSFDETTPYTKGQYVWYENVLCRFLVDHEPGAFVDEEVEYLSEDGLSGEVATSLTEQVNGDAMLNDLVCASGDLVDYGYQATPANLDYPTQHMNITRAGVRVTFAGTKEDHTIDTGTYPLVVKMNGTAARVGASSAIAGLTEPTKLVVGRTYRLWAITTQRDASNTTVIIPYVYISGTYTQVGTRPSGETGWHRSVAFEYTQAIDNAGGVQICLGYPRSTSTVLVSATVMCILEDTTDAGDKNIAPIDTTTAKDTHNPGDLLTVGGQLYEATQAIAPGTAITPGTNVEETTVAAQLAERDTAIAQVISNVPIIENVTVSSSYAKRILAQNGSISVSNASAKLWQYSASGIIKVVITSARKSSWTTAGPLIAFYNTGNWDSLGPSTLIMAGTQHTGGSTYTEEYIVPPGTVSFCIQSCDDYGTPTLIRYKGRADENLADVENATAKASHTTGSLLMLGGKLYTVTSAIATGETITPGTNVAATTVAAQLADRDTTIADRVQLTEQSLTDAQKAQARENIEAVGTDEMSAEFLCRMLFGNEDDWSVPNYDSMSYSATKTGRIITYKGNNNTNSGFQSVNLTGVPGAPHTVRSGNFSNIVLADTDFVPIPAWLANVSNGNTAIVKLLGYFHADRYNAENHTGYAVDYVLRKYNTETGEYEYSARTTTPLGGLNTATTADEIDKISVAQLIPDSRGGSYVKNWSEWEEIAIFAIRRNRMASGTVLLTPTYEPYGDQKPVIYSSEQTLTAAEQQQARSNIGAASEADAEDIYMEPWQLVAKKYFLPDRAGNLTVRRNHITYRPSGSATGTSVRSLIGAYEGANTTLGGYTPTIDQLIPVSVFGDAIKIGFYLDAEGAEQYRYPRFAYKFCTVDGETVTPVSDAYGTVPTTAATGVLAETSVTIPDGATHVFFGLLYSNGYTENATYDMVYKVDKG